MKYRIQYWTKQLRQNRFIYLTLGCILLFSCANNRKPENSLIDIDSNGISIKRDIQHTQISLQENFDLEVFKDYADSIISILRVKDCNYGLTVDTINFSNLKSLHLDTTFSRYLIDSADLAISSLLSDTSHNNYLNVKVVILHFDDSINCKRIFSKMQEYSTTRGQVDNFKYLPGLTYQNDLVVKGKLSIFWLNTGCPISLSNHLKYVHGFKRSFMNFTIQDSIKCECGDVICK